VNRLEQLHEAYASTRRVDVLASHIVRLLPKEATLLDVGCGDGLLSSRIAAARPDTRIAGLEVKPRAGARIAVEPFDGRELPREDRSVDVVLFADVLHHCEDPLALLREARRVARKALVIKDHCADGFLAVPTLRFMDAVSNRRHAISAPVEYWPRRRWFEVFEQLGLCLEIWLPRLGMFPWPAGTIFGRGLHFIARLGLHPGSKPGVKPNAKRGLGPA